MRDLFEKADLAKWAMELGLRKTVHAEVTDAELERWAALTQDTPEHKNLRKMARKELARRAAETPKERAKRADCPQGTRWMEGSCRKVAFAHEEAPMGTMRALFEDLEFDTLCEDLVPRMNDYELIALAEGTVDPDAVVAWMLAELDAGKMAQSKRDKAGFRPGGGTSPAAWGGGMSKPQAKARGAFGGKKNKWARQMKHHATKEMARRGSAAQGQSPSLQKGDRACPAGEKMVFGKCQSIDRATQAKADKMGAMRKKLAARGVKHPSVQG